MDDDVRDLFRSDYARVVHAVRAVVGSQAVAEELAQEAFCRAIERWPRVRDHEQPGAWVQLVALRLAVRHERRRRAGDALEPAWTSATTPEPVDVDLERAIAGMPRGQREAVVLHHLCDLGVVRVAEVLKVSPGTVKTQLHRGRARLAEVLGEREEVGDVAR